MTSRVPAVHTRLRVRLAATFALGALVLAATIAVVTYFLSERYLLDQRVNLATRQTYVDARVVRDTLQLDAEDPTAVLSTLDVGDERQAFIRRGGEWYASGLTAGPSVLPRELRELVRGGEAGRQRFDLEGQTALAVGVPVPAIDGAFYEVFRLDELHDTLAVIRNSLFAAAVATTLAAALLGIWAARRVLRPVNEVSTAAARIASGDLAARLQPQPDPDLEQVVSSFNTMAEALEQRIERDARFVSDVSHELRSPLTTLSTSADILERSRDELPPRSQAAVDLVLGEVARFRQVVEELLELSRAEAQVDPVDLSPVRIGDLIVNITTRYRAEPLVVEISPDVASVQLLLDKRRLERILANLLENARTHGRGAIRIGASRRGEWLRIEVDDAGPGVDPSEREHIFDRFYRGAKAGDRAADSSTGLGLALVAEHSRIQGGRVFVEDRPGGPGARFVVEIPWRTA